jgi:hypothetical protein
MYAAGMTLKEENYSRSKKPLKNKAGNNPSDLLLPEILMLK